jgi:hypothetical protein
MSESEVGLIEPCTRQNPRSLVKSGPGPNAGAGDLKAPDATVSAAEIVVFGSVSEAKDSQVRGAAAVAALLAALAGDALLAGSVRLQADSAADIAIARVIVVLVIVSPRR